jgi:hypothetical protein
MKKPGEDDEEVPDPLAMLDQALAEQSTVARFIKGYYDQLRLAGFDDERAMVLTIQYQSAMLMRMS